MASRWPEPSIAWCANFQAVLPPGRPGNVPTSPQLKDPPRVKLIKWECKGGRDERTGDRGKEETFITAEIVMKLDNIA